MCEICENMATYEGKLKSMKTKIKLIKLTDEETQRTIEKGHVPSLERQQRVLKTKLEEVYSLKVEIQEFKIQSDEETDNIREWSSDIDSQLTTFEGNIEKLESVIKELNKRSLEQTKQDEEQLIEQMKKKQFEREMKFEEEKFEQRMVYEKKIEESRQAQVKTKDNLSRGGGLWVRE